MSLFRPSSERSDRSRRKRSSVGSFILVLALLFFLAVFYAPSFLLISDAPAKADAVVFFLGGEEGTREKEASQLVREGDLYRGDAED